MLYTVSTGLGLYCSLIGIGSRDSKSEGWPQDESIRLRNFSIWFLVYIAALAVIRSSVCASIRRISGSLAKHVRVAVYVLLAMTWWAFAVVFVGILSLCDPVEAVWRPQAGSCAGARVLMALGQVVAVSTVAVDVSLVAVPVMLLCKLPMNKWKKWQLLGLVLFSSASVSNLTLSLRQPCLRSENQRRC